MNGGYNFGCAAGYLGDANDCYGAAQEVQINFPHTTAEYFQLNGQWMCTGDDLYYGNCSDDSNPVYRAYRDWLFNTDDTCHPARPSWDPLTVLAAIVGLDEAGLWAQEGTDEIDEDGNENFDTDWTTNNEYNLIYQSDWDVDRVTGLINEALCAGSKVSKEFLQ